MHKTKFRLAVVGVVSSGKEVLLVRKRFKPEKELTEKWMFPGGDVRFGEEPRDALKSILAHDLDLDVEVGEIIGLGAHYRRRGDRTEFISTLWLQAIAARKKEINIRAKWSSAEWVPREEVFRHLSDATRRWLPPEVLEYLMV